MRKRKPTDMELKPKRNPFEIFYRPKNQSQERVAREWTAARVLLMTGPPGTGKTASGFGHSLLDVFAGKYKKIMLCRPAVGVGKTLGYVKGDMNDKLGVWMGPIRDVLKNMSETAIQSLPVELISLEHIRGRNVDDAILFIDEVQNLEYDEIKAIVTRLCKTGKIVMCGDTSQSDLRRKSNPFACAASRIRNLPGVVEVKFRPEDNMRDPLVNQMIEALG